MSATMSPTTTSQRAPLASIVISTYNRAEALGATLRALDRQDTPADQYEVVVVDDGSSDDTWAVLNRASPAYVLVILRHTENRGVSAGRNTGIRNARGRYLILVSDDLLVPEDFVRVHVSTLERFPGAWVVGGFQQLDEITQTPFGRYLDELERGFEEGRKAEQLGPDLWAMEWPTARNLSIPRADLEQIGLFDERFRTCCEDQDLAERALRHDVRFIYNASIECLHNDQAADLERYCRFQERGARDTVLFCAKHPERHGDAPLVRINGRPSRHDGAGLIARKIAKSVLSRPGPTRMLVRGIEASERRNVPDRWLFAAYRVVIGLAIFRGWRQGLRDAAPVCR
jgi:GT2 family glycosyltransferase